MIEADTRAISTWSPCTRITAFSPTITCWSTGSMTWTQGEATSRGEIAEVRFVDPLMPPEGTSPATAAAAGRDVLRAQIPANLAGETGPGRKCVVTAF